MTKEDFQKVKVGDTLIEGCDHFITVESIWNNDRIVYKEDGYWYGEVDDIDDSNHLVYRSHDAENGVELPMGTIKLSTGKDLTWEDEPYYIGEWEDDIAWYIDK